MADRLGCKLPATLLPASHALSFPPPCDPCCLLCRSSARIACFRQSQVEDMRGQAGATALAYMLERWPQEKEQPLRNHLGSFGIKGATATQPLATLSGGAAAGGRAAGSSAG